MSLCLCGKYGRNHEITDACLTPEEQALVRAFKAEYDRASLGPWWHQAAGRDESQGHSATDASPINTSAQQRKCRACKRETIKAWRKQAAETLATSDRPHGVWRYTLGCRCEVCRAAKAEYGRSRARVSSATDGAA